MPGPLNLLKSDFSGGQVTDSALGRVDLDEYRSSVRRARNVQITSAGSLLKRTGASYVWSAESGGTPDGDMLTSTKWLRFIQTDGSSIALLVTESTIYGFFNGGQALQYDPDETWDSTAQQFMKNGAAYTAQPLASVDIDDWAGHSVRHPMHNIRYVQIGDSLYCTRPNKPVYRLKITVHDLDEDGDGDRLQLEWSKLEYKTNLQPRIISGLIAATRNASESIFYIAGRNPTFFLWEWLPGESYGRIRSLPSTITGSNHPFYIFQIGGSVYLGSSNINISGKNIKKILPRGLDDEYEDKRNYPSIVNSNIVGICHYLDTAVIALEDRLVQIDVDGEDDQGSRLATWSDFSINGLGGSFTANTLDGIVNVEEVLYGIIRIAFNSYSYHLVEIDIQNSRFIFKRSIPKNILYGSSFNYRDKLAAYDNAERAMYSFDVDGNDNQYEIIEDNWPNDRVSSSSPVGGSKYLAGVVSPEQFSAIELENKGFSSIAYYQGRLALAGHPQLPNALFLSDVNAFDTFTEGTEDDDALFLQLVTGPDSGIHWMGTWQDRLVMASVDAIYQLRAPGNQGVVTPSSFSVLRTSNIGSSFEVEPLVSEQGLLMADQGNHGLYRYNYDYDSDLFFAAPATQYARDIEGRRIVGLGYAHGSPANVLVDSIATGLRTRNDLINLQLLSFAGVEKDDNLSGVEFLFPSEWDGLGGSLITPEGMWLCMIGGSNPDAQTGQHPFMVGYIDSAGDEELDFSTKHAASAAFTRITGGLSHFGDGKTVTVNDRENGTSFQRTVDSSGGLSGSFPATRSVEIGLPLSALIETLPLANEAPTFGQPSRVSKVRAYMRKPEPSLARDSTPLQARRAVSDETYDSRTRHFTGAGGTPYWIEMEMSGERDPNNGVIIEMSPTERTELLALSFRYESGDN